MQAKAVAFIVEGELHEHYIVVMAGLRFEWDARKSAGNARKHGVTFEETRSAFADPDGKVIDDPDHSDEETDTSCLPSVTRCASWWWFTRYGKRPM